jgi:adenosine deaminase CECR1
MLPRALFLWVTFWLPILGGLSSAQGLPDSSQAYRAGKARLLAADAALRFDAEVHLNAQELRVNEELVSLRRALTAQYKKERRFPPSLPFYAVKKEIEQTELYRFLRGMPKGGVLHLHTSSTAPASWLIQHGIREPNCCVCWPDDKGKALKGQIGFFRADQIPAGYRAVADLIAEDAAFPDQLQALLTINADDAVRTNLEIWTKFNNVFQRIRGLATYQPVFARYYEAAFRTLLADKVFYVELRAGFGSLYDLDGVRYDHKKVADIFWEVRNKIRKDHKDFDLKLIYSGYRGATIKDVWKDLTIAIELRKLWADKNFVIGFDLVGEEDAGHTTEFFLPDWVRLKGELAAQKTTLPFYFHDGESDWPSDENLYDAFLLGSKRIGHGFNLFRFPTLEQRLKQHGVTVEVCPISNQLLRYVSDLRMHPADGYLRRGVPCVLSNDDPGILGNDGLSYDFWVATLAWELDLRALKQLALNSLRHSGMTDAEKRTALGAWQQQWEAWLAASSAR